MNESPWSAYGRIPPKPQTPSGKTYDAIFGAMADIERGREQVERYLNGVLREYHEIRAGARGYGNIIKAALDPSPEPESIEERLMRLARDAEARRKRGPRSK